jgi:hypothetical protein
MNSSTHFEVLSEAERSEEHCGNPRVPIVLEELCSNEPTPPRNPVGPDVPNEGSSQTFVHGAGI